MGYSEERLRANQQTYLYALKIDPDLGHLRSCERFNDSKMRPEGFITIRSIVSRRENDGVNVLVSCGKCMKKSIFRAT
ncbi:hypothetical protein LSPH24S_08039 [Lysinibacillus sphaericus]